ncbi:carboxypeptidase regulatory-like domain-containing protein [Hyalangium rubrum]|uniref:Carboxypeptidase regulatory-like domain-containing protein n=1 Tax=Hyalangium rubrum TaxID=3103134 RepID=A0ABU5H8E3_9BACT|nr:carboxypeptidase regulatory-like domain-containing protein [Hyalangium sp. s54d21]MDY7229746.1 carboxypeptidase regulatory-like domain-containing protein [Hyalangium sp. s54d21]
MRHTLHISMVALLALIASGCGGLDNAPFLVGSVHGRLTESDSAMALVSVVGAPELRSSVAPDGQFTLENIPAGRTELFIVASAQRALRVPLTVPSGQSLSLGELQPQAASFLEVRVKSPDKQLVGAAKLSVLGTPLQELDMDEQGRVSVGPLPDGCFMLSITLPGFPDVSSETCVSAGETKEVKVNLPKPDGGNGHHGCMETGCEEALQCAQDGRCVECLEDAHCGSGLSCRGFRCEGSGPLCAPCAGNWQCRSGASCQSLPEGSSACVERCTDSEDCARGFTCQGDRCLPDAAQFSGCGAYRQVGAACTGDASCRERGLPNGLCIEGACTYRCTSDSQCPDSLVCEEAPGGRVCQSDD